jgi:hypothetical protein
MEEIVRQLISTTALVVLRTCLWKQMRHGAMRKETVLEANDVKS